MDDFTYAERTVRRVVAFAVLLVLWALTPISWIGKAS